MFAAFILIVILVVAVGVVAYFKGYADGKAAGSSEEAAKYRKKIKVEKVETVVED